MRLFTPDADNFDALVDDFSWTVADHFNIAEAVCDRHAKSQVTADSVAIHCVSESATASYTFAQLHGFANQLANLLQSLNIERGDRVAIILPQCVETAIGHIAAHKLAAVSLPLSVLFGVEALQHRLGDSSARVVITDTAHAERIRSLSASLPALEYVLVTDAEISLSDDNPPDAGSTRELTLSLIHI